MEELFTISKGENFMIDYKSIGKQIRIFRRNADITQELLAEKINVSPPYISRIETGSASPSLQTLVDICNVLNTTIDNLMQDSLPAARKQSGGRLSALLSDCSTAEIVMIEHVVDVLLQDLRNMQKR